MNIRMAGYPIKSDIITCSKLTKQRAAFLNNVRSNVVPTQGKKCGLAIPADMNTFNPIALINANPATHQNSLDLHQKNSRKISQRAKIP